MSEYASLLGDAILRHRARVAEHTARVEAELASKVKSEFISNMSHELRTPLNTVLGFSKILSDHGSRKLNETEIIEYAGLINDAAGHLLSVINDILDISKIQSGRYTLDASEISVGMLLEQVVEQHQELAREAQLEIFSRLPKDLPAVRGDDHKLVQVFNNLISNAIKFTEPGGQVAIDALRLADEGLAILIRDSGIGMSEEEINIALTPFGQVDGSRTRWREGTGLGLPIAKSLVELHGGKLEIKSVQGQGTEVAVLLPSRHHVSIVRNRDALLGEGVSV
ncbi:MAG: ATP-binding protein [Pseudomonadota bacterium]